LEGLEPAGNLMRIGVFDSGLGGLFATKELVKRLPDYDYVYLGDTKNVPYGNRSKQAVYDLTRGAVEFLLEQDCQLVILACNTASAFALRKIQQEYLPNRFHDRKVLGVLIPIVEGVANGNGSKVVGVLATRGTVESEVFVKEFKKYAPKIKVVQQAAPLLVPLIEYGGLKWSKPILTEYLRPLKAAKIDTLVLGCTHFAIIKERIRKIVGENVKVVSEADVLPQKVGEYLIRHPEIEVKLTRRGTVDFLVTDITDSVVDLANKWFGNGVKLKLAKY
jgi:glutamate racemase